MSTLNASPSLSNDWPISTPLSNEKSTSQPCSALPRTPKKKENGSVSKTRSRGKHRSRRSEILRRLDVDEDQLAEQPQIAPLLRLNGIRPERLVEVLRCDSNPESMKFVQKYDELTPAGRHLAGLEAIAVSVGLLPRRLWELFAGAALVQSKESIAVMIAMSLPEVMRVTIKGAKKAKGLADREHLFKSARILPTPKGSTTVINMGGQKELEEGKDDDDGKGDLEPADGFLLNTAKIMSPKLKQLAPARFGTEDGVTDASEETLDDDSRE